MQTTDRHLIERIVAKDGDAFDELLTRYRDEVVRHADRIVRDEATADDVAQEVFLRVWDRADQWNEEGSFRSWLLRIATNVSLTHLRTVRRRREQRLELSLDEGKEEKPAPDWIVERRLPGPDTQYERQERRHLLRRLVAKLSEEKREVFHLIYDAEVEVREAAERLGVPEGTIKSRLHHGRREIARAWRRIETSEEG